MNECPLGFECNNCKWHIDYKDRYECAIVVLTKSIVNLKECWGRIGD